MGKPCPAQGTQAAYGGGQAARSPRSGQEARPIFPTGRRRRWPGVLASKGVDYPNADRELLEGAAPRKGLRAALHSARSQPRPVEDFRALRLLQGRNVRPDGCGGRPVPDQAHELPLPLPCVQGRPSLLQASSDPLGRDGHGVPLRTKRHSPRADASARLHPGRRPHLLPTGAARGRDHLRARPDRGDPEPLWFRQASVGWG
ncbi:unnamed protein product [Ectocarpus sp. 13 AM-2016]